MKRSNSARGEHHPDTLTEAPVLKRGRFDEPLIHSIPLECLGAFLTSYSVICSLSDLPQSESFSHLLLVNIFLRSNLMVTVLQICSGSIGMGRQVCKLWHTVLSSPTISEWLRKQICLWEVLCYSISQWNGWGQPCDHHPLLAWGFSEKQVGNDIIRNYKSKWRKYLNWQEFEDDDSVDDR